MSETNVQGVPLPPNVDPELVAMLKKRYKCPQFRILIIGQANAGKTTILEKVCGIAQGTEPIILDKNGVNLRTPKPKSSIISRVKQIFRTKSSPSLTHLKPSVERGLHDIEHQIMYRGSNFIFHDSEGFECGGSEEMDKVWEFIEQRANVVELRDQLHVIWYCIPMDGCRPLSPRELQFFEKGTGKVPLVVIFTKFDAQVIQEYAKLDDTEPEEVKWDKARVNAEQTFQEVYQPKVMMAEHPPKAFVKLEDMDKPDKNCPELTEKTADAIEIASLRQLFTSTQMNNLDICTKSALEGIINSTISKWFQVFVDVYQEFPHFWREHYKYHELLYLYYRYRDRYDLYRDLYEQSILKDLLALWRVEINNQFAGNPTDCQIVAAMIIIARKSFWTGMPLGESLKVTLKQFKGQDYVEKLKAQITSDTLPLDRTEKIQFMYQKIKEL